MHALIQLISTKNILSSILLLIAKLHVYDRPKGHPVPHHQGHSGHIHPLEGPALQGTDFFMGYRIDHWKTIGTCIDHIDRYYGIV